MTNTICLDEKYSTTRLAIQEKPEIANDPSDTLQSVLFLPIGEGRKGEGGLRAKGSFKKSYKDKPLITVVTVVFNGEKHLEQTIRSVIGQTYDNVEYIIIDGGSTDGTLDIIRRYEEAIDYWVSEKDGGIYDAMNKGISLATGDWINFMNAGDSFLGDKTIQSVFEKIDYGEAAVVYGDVLKLYSNKYEFVHRSRPLDNLYKELPFSHQAAFTKAEILRKFSFDTQYKICADHDFFYKLYSKNFKFVWIDMIVANYDMDGLSTHYLKVSTEEKRIEACYSKRNKIYYNRKRFFIIAVKETIKSFLSTRIVNFVRYNRAIIRSKKEKSF
jgi:glycosyltransferase involved in cell wall biosynthesis